MDLTMAAIRTVSGKAMEPTADICIQGGSIGRWASFSSTASALADHIADHIKKRVPMS